MCSTGKVYDTIIAGNCVMSYAGNVCVPSEGSMTQLLPRNYTGAIGILGN